MTEDKNKQLELKHSIGDTVQLQFTPENEDERFYVKLIGFLNGKSIIVTTPRENGVALRIPLEQKFNVRLISGNSAKGFTASTIHATTHPYPHLHLTFPKTLESITVRKAERIECSLIVSVHNEEEGKSFPEGKSASMNNLSTAGAQLISNEDIGELGDKILISCQVNVAEIKEYLNISGVIRRINKTEKDESHSYGIEFIIPDNKDKLLLHGFIYEHMLNISL